MCLKMHLQFELYQTQSHKKYWVTSYFLQFIKFFNTKKIDLYIPLNYFMTSQL